MPKYTLENGIVEFDKNWTCYGPELDIEKKQFNKNGIFLFTNDSVFQMFLDSIFYFSYGLPCSRPYVDFTKNSLIGFNVEYENKSYGRIKVEISESEKKVKCIFYNCSSILSDKEGSELYWFLTPKIDSTYTISYFYEKI